MTTASNDQPSAARAVTVWSLELADAARLRAPARPPARKLRMAVAGTPGTSERLYRSVGADWQWTDRTHWTADRWAAWEQRVETHVAFVDGEEAGYAELDPSQHGSVEIAYFGCCPPSTAWGSAATCWPTGCAAASRWHRASGFRPARSTARTRRPTTAPAASSSSGPRRSCAVSPSGPRDPR